MNLARVRAARRLASLVALTVAAFAVLASAHHATASAQVVADPDYYKGTPERQATVYRFAYSQSPQTIPAGYDPVREAEEILRQQQRTLPASNPQAQSVWRQIRDMTGKARLSPAVRVLTPVFLGATAFEIGWKIGTGINAKFLRIGIPADNPGNGAYDALLERLEFKTAGTSLPQTFDTMPEDGWLWVSGGRYVVERPGSDPCPRPLTAPTGYIQNPGGIATPTCPGVVYQIQLDSYYLPESGLGAAGPIEDYTNQPYSKSTSAPPAPAQTNVEQAIDTELDKPENELLRDWLNYALGSPGATDPIGEGEDNPEIEFIEVYRHWRDHGHKFTPEYEDPHKYWEGAIDVIRRGQDPSDPDVTSCRRSDGAIIYWDFDEAAWVIVKDGKIVTYYPPDRGFDDYVAECSK
jgi:hypothetical protein